MTGRRGGALTTAAPSHDWPLDATAATALGAAGVLIVVGGLVAAVNSATPFAHGSWLAAYLVLVGGVAQALLVAGRSGARGSAGRRRPELALWNGGTLVVALGVLVDVPAIVALGSVALLLALVSFGAAPATDGARWRPVAYRGLVLALAGSVLVGCALAFAT